MTIDESDGPGLWYRSREGEFYLLWILAAATYGVGDMITTIAGVYGVPAIAEGNVVLGAIMATHGLGGLVGIKLVVFGLALSLSVASAGANPSRFWYYAPPVALTVIGTFLTAWNLLALFGLR